MRLKLQRECWDGFFDDAQPLVTKHHAEIDHWPDIPFRLDANFYRIAEEAGSLRIYTARLDRGPTDPFTLIGYAGFFVRDDPHTGQRQAVADAVYLDPEQRGGWVGFDLLSFAERQLKAEGVQAIYHAVKVAHPALGVILKRQGYQHVEQLWAKRIR